jgi:hypothetical protein
MWGYSITKSYQGNSKVVTDGVLAAVACSSGMIADLVLYTERAYVLQRVEMEMFYVHSH